MVWSWTRDPYLFCQPMLFSGFLEMSRLYRWSSWISEAEGPRSGLAVVRDLRQAHALAEPDELAAVEPDVSASDRT